MENNDEKFKKVKDDYIKSRSDGIPESDKRFSEMFDNYVQAR